MNNKEYFQKLNKIKKMFLKLEGINCLASTKSFDNIRDLIN